MRVFITTTSCGAAPTSRPSPSRGSPRGTGARAARLEVALDAEARPVLELLVDERRASRGCRPSELPAKYATSLPSAASGTWNSARSERVAGVELPGLVFAHAATWPTACAVARAPRNSSAVPPSSRARWASSMSVSEPISAPGSCSPSGNG